MHCHCFSFVSHVMTSYFYGSLLRVALADISVNCQPTISRLLVDSRPVVYLYMTGTSQILHPQLIATHGPMQFGQVLIDIIILIDHLSTIGQLSFDSQSTMVRLLVDYRLIVDRYLTDISIG